MSDMAVRALMQSILGGISAQEDQALISEVARRFILNGMTISSSGVLSFTLPVFNVSVLTGTANRVAAFDGSGNGISTLITNALVDPAAAIARSKLDFGSGLVNADIAAAAAIAYSKLNLATSIVNGDINAAAAIAWTKLDKTGSSLADLTTRSAGALNSGNLPAAQLPSGAVSWSLSSLALNAGLLDLSAGSAGQIKFPATQNASSDANTLDDYEEGTWTPVIGGDGGTSGQTYTVQVGRYIKVGKLVWATYEAVLSAKGTITGNVIISGLPFTSENVTGLFPTGALIFQTLATNWVTIVAHMVPNTTTALLKGANAAAASNNTALATADINNTTTIIGTVVYQASA